MGAEGWSKVGIKVAFLVKSWRAAISFTCT